MGIDGTVGFDGPSPIDNEARGYDQWFAVAGLHPISRDLSIALEEGFIPSPSHRFEIFKTFVPSASSDPGWYVDWFENITLDRAWPNPEDWVWEFEYKDGGTGRGDAPDAGRTFYSAALRVVPEPGTLVLLSMGVAAVVVWSRSHSPRTRLSNRLRSPRLGFLGRTRESSRLPRQKW